MLAKKSLAVFTLAALLVLLFPCAADPQAAPVSRTTDPLTAAPAMERQAARIEVRAPWVDQPVQRQNAAHPPLALASHDSGLQLTMDSRSPWQRGEDLPLVEAPAELITHTVYLPCVLRGYDNSLVFFDGFHDPGTGWKSFSTPDFHFVYVDGEYEIFMGLPHNFTDASAPIGAMSGNYSVEADIRRLGGSDSAYGLMLEHPGSWYAYWLTVTPETQEYSVLLTKAPGETIELASGSSSYINPGDATNHLKAERIGSDIRVSANGHVLATVTDTTHVGGEVGVTEWAGDSAATARFDNFAVWRLP